VEQQRSVVIHADREPVSADLVPPLLFLLPQYVNNKPLCDLIENKPGLLSICDDCCATAKTDQNFVMDLKGYFSGNPNIQCGQNDFSVRHYAGDVRVSKASADKQRACC
jgi:hypothetical protein